MELLLFLLFIKNTTLKILEKYKHALLYTDPSIFNAEIVLQVLQK